MRVGVLPFSTFLLSIAVCGQTLPDSRSLMSVQPMDRATGPLDPQQRIVLQGNVHPLAKAGLDIGRAPGGQRMDRMILVLKPDGRQQAALEEFLRAQQDPESPFYRQSLTPEEFGRHFGVSENDLRTAERWLEGYGMTVEEAPAARTTLIFSGTAAQVEAAFHTAIRNYSFNGETHFANASDPEIPQALAGVVGGVVSLHDFRSAPMHKASPAYTASNGVHSLAPQDWVTIYDVGPLYGQGIDGSGQSIAVLGRADITLSDVRTFRSISALPVKDPQILVNGPDPGYPGCDDEMESTLDVEWAGAIARNATVLFVTSKSGASDGVALSAQYAISHQVAPIVTLSYGQCEASSGSSGNSFWNALWSQAAAQRMTVLVSSGDSGAAGCDSSGAATATYGRAVNALCSTPFSTCVGGTMFNDAYNPNLYWSPSNGTGMSSALSYIPELPWNESGAASGALWAGGGGASIVYAKPAWQSAPGVPADGVRDVPDVSMAAAIHDAYLIEFQNGLWGVGGTSAAAPSLASVLALVLQNAGTPLGNVNPALYALATRQLSSGGAAVFHDITSGNNSVPGVTGFTAGRGYDLATGLGSVDANLLVNHWNDASSVNFVLTPNPSSVSVAVSKSNTATLTLTRLGGFTSPVALSASGQPAGVTVTFSPTSLTTSSTVTIAASSSAAAGTYTLTLTGTGGGLTRTARITLTVIAPTFTLSGPTGATVAAGSTAPATFSSVAGNGFNSAVALAVSGLPSGVTAKFVPASILAPGNGSSTLTFTAAGTAAGSATLVTVTATGGTVTKAQQLTLTVLPASFNLTLNLTANSLTPNSSIKNTITTAAVNGFKSAITLSASGMPSGVTASFSPASIASPGNGTSTLTLTAGAAPVIGTYNLIITATGAGVTKLAGFVMTVAAPSFTLTLGGTTVVLNKGGSMPIPVSTAKTGTFNAAIALSVSGLPAGATGKFAPTSIAAPGTGTTYLTLASTSSAKSGTYNLTVTATGGGQTKTQPLTLKIN